MDRDADTSANIVETTGPAAANAKPGSVIISVCTTCKPAASETSSTGPALLDAVGALLPKDDAAIAVRAVQCLGVCKRPATASVSGADGYTFVFGDLQIDSGAVALAQFAQSYRRADYGLVPWRERAEVLRKGMIARIPPAVWSPHDGRPPK